MAATVLSWAPLVEVMNHENRSILLVCGVATVIGREVTMKSAKIFAATVLVVVGIAAPHAANGAISNLVVNGSFEDGAFDTNSPTFNTLNATNTNIAGWEVTSGSIDWIGSYWQASDGVRSLDMNGLTAGTILQSIPTVMGQAYTVTFDISGNPDGGPAAKTLEIIATIGGSQSFSYSTADNGTTKSNMKWKTESFTFTAGSSLTTLAFTSLTTGDSGVGGYPNAFGPALDNVVMVAAVPEVSSFGVWSLLGAIGLTLNRRRRKPLA